MEPGTVLKAMPNILAVDDTPADLQLLTSMLKERGYRVRPVTSGKLALQAARSAPPDLILLDINMPELNGYQVCEQLKADSRLADIPVVFISALSGTNDKIKAFAVGGVDYITKPFHLAEVDARVNTHLKIRSLQASLEAHNRNLRHLVDEQVKQILATKEELSQSQLATIVALSKLAEARDEDTGQHIERAQVYCRMLAEQLRRQKEYAATIDDAFIDNVYHAAPLHDIGKVAIPDHILFKPGKLTAHEFEVMKTHTTLGARTLQAVCVRHAPNAFITIGIEIAYAHHEKWDGAGYPRGLSGSEIPLSARIMALADVYDALTTERCYKDAFTHQKSRDIICRGRGSQFEPAVVDAFLALESQFQDVRNRMNDRRRAVALEKVDTAGDLDSVLELIRQVGSQEAPLATSLRRLLEEPDAERPLELIPGAGRLS